MHWVFVTVLKLFLVEASRSYSLVAVHELLILVAAVLECVGSVVVAHGLSSCNSQAPECGLIVAQGLSCPTACGIFPEQGSNLCPLHWLTTGPPWKSEIQLGF